MAQWREIPLDKELYQNVDETILTRANAAMENCYINETGGQSAFPGRRDFAQLPGGTRTYLHDWRGNLIATTDEGRCYRLNQEGDIEDVTGVQIAGGRRPVFDKTEDQLLIAAGGQIVELDRDRTQVLSEDAPETTHVAFTSGYVIAIEPDSGRMYHTSPGLYKSWNPIDLFTAESKPDPLNAAIVTPYNELLLCGEDSIEQFEPLANGSRPFYRRWTTGEGLFAPYTIVVSDNGTYGINKLREFVRFSQQVSKPVSDEINFVFERVENWDEAWAVQMHVKGQKFILLQIPNAENAYGTKGISALFDYRGRRWSNLYDWDEHQARPVRWGGWSYRPLWGRHFIGVAGGVQELTFDQYSGGNRVQRVLVRTGHIDSWGPCQINNFRLRLRRGITPANVSKEARVGIRVNPDNTGFGRWVYEPLGRPGMRDMMIEFGPMGTADTWQWEYQISDDVPVEVVQAKALVEGMDW